MKHVRTFIIKRADRFHFQAKVKHFPFSNQNEHFGALYLCDGFVCVITDLILKGQLKHFSYSNQNEHFYHCGGFECVIIDLISEGDIFQTKMDTKTTELRVRWFRVCHII